MACFIAPLTIAIATTSLEKKLPERLHINWLLAILWGGVLWLIPEHILSGEIAFTPPFFTAGSEKIITEILSVGVPMVGAALVVWAVLLALSRVGKIVQLNPAVLAVFGSVLMIAVDRLIA